MFYHNGSADLCVFRQFSVGRLGRPLFCSHGPLVRDVFVLGLVGKLCVLRFGTFVCRFIPSPWSQEDGRRDH